MSYEFEIHRNNQQNELVTIESSSMINAYFTLKDTYPNVLTIVSTDPTIDLMEGLTC